MTGHTTYQTHELIIYVCNATEVGTNAVTNNQVSRGNIERRGIHGQPR